MSQKSIHHQPFFLFLVHALLKSDICSTMKYCKISLFLYKYRFNVTLNPIKCLHDIRPECSSIDITLCLENNKVSDLFRVSPSTLSPLSSGCQALTHPVGHWWLVITGLEKWWVVWRRWRRYWRWWWWRYWWWWMWRYWRRRYWWWWLCRHIYTFCWTIPLTRSMVSRNLDMIWFWSSFHIYIIITK